MSTQHRMAAFGTAGVVALVGVLCGIVVPGEAGQLLAIALVSIGLGAIVLLVFFEIGLSEDHDREREEERRQRDAREAAERPARSVRAMRWRPPRRP
ncbi:MAG TPA: hypothetical protein VMD48_14915 [Solirubrobacteraceae bacterium]|nr:hypothetical protein [Solirubrobacteraceae bacterium]